MSDVPVQITMDSTAECGYQCGMCCGDCIRTGDFLNVNYCSCNFSNCVGVLGTLSWFVGLMMTMMGLLFLCCDRGRITQRTGSCNFLWLTVAPSVFTFLMAVSTVSIGAALLLLVVLCVLWKKWGPSVCRRVCRCNNFAHGLEREWA